MNTIIGKRYVGIHDEKLASGVITPGMLVKRTSADAVIAHNVAGGMASPLFAIEDDNQSNGIDDNYANGALVKLWKPIPGEQVFACVDDDSSNVIAIGDFLESDGEGRLRKVTTATSDGNDEFASAIVAVALEAATPGTTTRLLVEIV